MFEHLKHFDHSARWTLELAQEEAQKLGHEQVDCIHVLLALTRDWSSPASRVLKHLGASAEKLREQVRPGAAASQPRVRGELPVTTRFKRMLQAALQESVRCRAGAVTTTHLLVALAADGTSTAGQALAALGADPQSLHAAVCEREGTLSIQRRDGDLHPSGPGAKSARPSVQRSELPTRPSRDRPRRLLPRLVMTVLWLQLLVFSLLTLTGWGALHGRDVDPPKMERVGPPPGLIETYASLSHITYPLQYGARRQTATAVFVGTPADWGGPEPSPPSLNVFGQSLAATIHQFSAGSHNTVLFVVPSAILQSGPLYVVVKGDRYRLTVVTDEASMGFAVLSTAVNNHLLPAFDSSLLWLTLPVPSSIHVALMLFRRQPATQAYTLTHGTLEAGRRGGVIASPIAGVTLGTPVVAITPTSNALAGFLEQPDPGPSSFVATSVVAGVLRAVAPSLSGGY